MPVTPRWNNNEYESKVLELEHEGKWTFQEMHDALKEAINDDEDVDKFVAVCIFPDEYYFPPDALTKAPGMVRSDEFKQLKGLVCVQHPIEHFFDTRSETLQRMLGILKFPVTFTPARERIKDEVNNLLQQITRME